MGIEIIGKLTQKNNGDFKLVDLENVDYDGTGKNAKQEIEKKIEDVKNSLDAPTIKSDIQDLKDNKINLIEDETSMEGISDTEHDTLETKDKRIIGAINEVNSQCKDIAKQTITEEERNKLTNLNNYDDSSIKSNIQNVQQQVNNLVLGAVGDGNNAEVVQARGRFGLLNSRFENVENDINLLYQDYEVKNLIFDIKRTVVEQQFVNGSGVIVTSSSRLARYITVEIKTGVPLYVSGTDNPTKVSTAHIGQIQVLDADKNVLVVVNETTSVDKVTCSIDEIPSTAKYLRINTAYNGNEFVGNLYVGYEPFQEKYLHEENVYENVKINELKTIIYEHINSSTSLSAMHTPNRLYGKKIVAIGDSMVAGNGVAEDDLWLTRIAKRNNMSYVNYGINGSFLSRKAGLVDKCDGVCDRTSLMDDDADYIIVYAGTNDAGNNITIGNESSTNKEEFIGALVQTCKQLLTKYPTGKIMFITPYKKYSTFIPYIEAIETICGQYGIPVFNNYKNGGICWQISAQTNLLSQGDNTHLNATGHEFVSYKFEEALRRL